MLKARIRNLLGIASADLVLPPGILLIAGHNGAGKTSILDALGAAASADWPIRGARWKKHLPDVVRAGANEGTVLLEYEGGSVRIAYPGGIVDQTGKPVALGTPLAIGRERWMAMPEESRLSEAQRRFDMEPSLADFMGWFKARPVAGMDPEAKPGTEDRKAVDELWEDVQEKGWDAVAKREASEVTMIQGKWTEATGQRWGATKHREWAPVGLHRGEAYDLDAASAAVRAAKAESDRIAGLAAVSAQKRDELAELVRGLPGRRQSLTKAEQRKEAADAEVEAILVALEKDGEPVDPRRWPRCPHCQAMLAVKVERGVGYAVEKAPTDRMDVATYEKAVAQRAAMVATLTEKRAVATEAAEAVRQARARVIEAETAEAELEAIGDKPVVTDEEVTRARLAVSEAEDHRDRVRRLRRAEELTVEWDRAVLIRDAIAPGGIRAQVIERRASEINVALSEISQGAGMAEVSFDPSDASLLYDGRPYGLISESEQWRVDFVMTLLLARREGARLLLLDRLDLLHPQARPGVLQALGRLRDVVCVIGMTARDEAAVPDLAKAKLGRTAWLGNATLEVRT